MPPPDFRPDRLLARLGRADVDYVVVGGVAAQAHGSAQFTGDLDIASLEDLIAMKRAAGRPKDLIAVEELEAIQRLLRESR